jgi:hypothetical protein
VAYSRQQHTDLQQAKVGSNTIQHHQQPSFTPAAEASYAGPCSLHTICPAQQQKQSSPLCCWQLPQLLCCLWCRQQQQLLHTRRIAATAVIAAGCWCLC